MRDDTVRHERLAGAGRSDRRGDSLPRFGLNRFDVRSVDAFAADVRRAEALGWDGAFLPDSQLRRRDTYVLLAAAARATERIALGPLLANPVTRHPTVTASSMATIDELAPGRTLLGWGIGDTAVRLAGLRPARVVELEAATRLMRGLLDGQAVEVGAARPARLPHHRPVPIWIAAGGPRTLRMAGSVADGVFLRVGTHPANIGRAVELVRAGAAEAGRDPNAVGLGAVFHTVLIDEPHRALTMARSMAAGYYEYSPALFDPPGLTWSGPHPEALKRDRGIWPDFHHAPDLEASGRVVDFLPPSAADAFCLRGGPTEIAAQLVDLLRSAPAAFDHVVLHPIPNPPEPDDPERGYMGRVAREVLPRVRSALAAPPRDPDDGAPPSLPATPDSRRGPSSGG
jgi:5,10-methylenetetrahydromethanopterin reductase